MIFQAWRIIADGDLKEQGLQIFVSLRHCWDSFRPALKIPIVVGVAGLLMLLRLLRLPSVNSMSGLGHNTLFVENLKHFWVICRFSER